MAGQLFFAFIGAVFGAVLASIPTGLRRLRALQTSRAVTRRRDLIDRGIINNWLLDYYDAKGADLFRASISGIAISVPILKRDEWIFNRSLDMHEDWPILQRPAPRVPPEVD